MININDLEIEYAYMGHFVGDKDWIHPDRVIDTYEIIFVTDGQVYINEGGVDYVLEKGDALVMRPGVRHYGYKKSDDTSFFWFHFYAKNYESVGDYRFKVADYYNYELLFRRLNHLATIGAPSAVIECEFALMLLNRKMELGENNKLFFEVADYIKVHIASAPTVSFIAQTFGR